MNAYCSRLWTIFGRAARMSVTTAQGEGGLENREGEERDETWTTVMSYIIHKVISVSLLGDKQRSRSLSGQRQHCNEPGPGMVRRTWTRKLVQFLNAIASLLFTRESLSVCLSSVNVPSTS